MLPLGWGFPVCPGLAGARTTTRPHRINFKEAKTMYEAELLEVLRKMKQELKRIADSLEKLEKKEAK